MEKNKKRFFMLWFGEFLSVIGSGITGFALSVDVYQKTGMASYYSLITLATVAPSILIRPFAGALADRYSRRIIMIIGNMTAGLGIVMLALLLHFGKGDLSIAQICFCMVISSLGTGLSVPSYASCITLLIPEDFYAVASGMVQVSGSGQYLISPMLASILIPIIGVEKVVFLDAASFLLVIIIVFWIRIPLKVENQAEDKEGIITTITKSITYLKDYKENVLLILNGIVVNFFMGFLIVLIGPMILSFSTQKWLGIGESISAMGMVVGSILVMFIKLPENLYNKIYSYVMIMGFGYALVGLTQNYLLIIVACSLFFYSIPFINTYTDVVFRKTIHKNMQGRVYALQGALVQVGYMFAYTFAGVLADYVFIPLFEEDGLLYSNIGKIIGVGPGRGIGFMFILCGTCILLSGMILRRSMNKTMVEQLEEMA